MKLITILALIFMLAPMAQAEGTQAELEVRQRDVVIGEMAEIIFHFTKDYTQEELVNYLRTSPKAISNPQIISVEGNYVFWGMTVKFEFKNGKLINVHW